MRKVNEVLRLRFELGLGQRAIARACSISQGAVHNYLKKAAAAGLRWPLPEGWDEQRIEAAFFGERRRGFRVGVGARAQHHHKQRSWPDLAQLSQAVSR